MDNVSKRIFDTGKVMDRDGVEYELHSHTSSGQCSFLQGIVTKIDAKLCLEVGLAYGVSALSVCEVISKKQESTFYSIDPQQDWWKNIGLKNLEEAGYMSFVKYYREYSYKTLPRLYLDNVRLDFAYIDTTKVFDIVMLDVFYIIMMLKVGGVFVLDDCDCPGLNKLSRYLAKMPHLEVFDRYGERRCTLKKKFASTIAKIVPYNKKIFSDKLMATECFLGVNARCVAFQKISDGDLCTTQQRIA